MELKRRPPLRREANEAILTSMILFIHGILHGRKGFNVWLRSFLLSVDTITKNEHVPIACACSTFTNPLIGEERTTMPPTSLFRPLKRALFQWRLSEKKENRNRESSPSRAGTGESEPGLGRPETIGHANLGVRAKHQRWKRKS